MGHSRGNSSEYGFEAEANGERAALCGWEIKSAPLGRAGWDEVAAALSCWPGGSISIERRFVARRSGALREYVLAATEGPELLLDSATARHELELVTASIRRSMRSPRVGAARLESLLQTHAVFDVCELPTIGPSHVDDSEAALLFDALLAALGSLPQASTLSLVIGSPPPGSGLESAVAGRIEQSGRLLTVQRPDQVSVPALRFRLRLASDHALPDTILAIASALSCGGPGEAAQGWRRAAGPNELRLAQAELAHAGLRSWTSDSSEDDPLTPASAAAAVLGVPVAGRRLGRTRIPMPPLASRPARSGVLIGRAPLGSGRMADVRLPWFAGGSAWCVGSTGSGKSTVLARVIEDTLESERACVILDPHRDLAELALSLVPSSRRRDVILIDAAESETAGLDLIPARVSAEVAPQVAARLADAFEELYNSQGEDYVGPWFIEVIAKAVETLLRTNALGRPAVLADVERFLGNGATRRELLDGLKTSDKLIEYWAQYQGRIDSPYNKGDVSYLTSKLSSLTDGPAGRLLARPPRFRLEDALAKGRIVICCLPIGELGVRTARLIGRMQMTRLFGALASGSRIRPKERPPVTVVIDEAQHVADGRILEAFLAATRKWNTQTWLANQSPNQLGARSLDAVLTNCRHVLAFRLPDRQARLLADRAEGAEQVIPGLPNYRMLAITPDIRSEAGPAVLEGPKPLGFSEDQAARTRAASLKRWGGETAYRHRGTKAKKPRAKVPARRRSHRRPPDPAELDRLVQEMSPGSAATTDPAPSPGSVESRVVGALLMRLRDPESGGLRFLLAEMSQDEARIARSLLEEMNKFDLDVAAAMLRDGRPDEAKATLERWVATIRRQKP